MLVIGASGRVGRLLMPAWSRAGAGVIVQRRGGAVLGAGLPEIRWSPLDAPHALPGLLAGLPPVGAMLVLAGVTPSSPGAGAELMALNTALAEACMRAAEQAGIGRVLLASSSAVYGAGRAEPWREDEPAQPATPYAQAKLAMERAAEPWRKRGLSICALRIGNVAGADALLLNAGRKEPLVIDRFVGGSGPLRSYIGPQTMARVLSALADPATDLLPVLNLAAPAPVSMDALARAAGLDWTWRPAPPQAIARLTLNCSALAARVAFDDSDSSAAGIVAQWNACRSPA